MLLKLTRDKAKELLISSLLENEDSSREEFMDQLLENKIPKVLSVWAPNKRYHIGHLLTARCISAIAALNGDCTVTISICMSGIDLTEDADRQKYARLGYRFLNDLFIHFTDNTVSIRQHKTENVEVPDIYRNACNNVLKEIEFENHKLFQRITSSSWGIKYDYASSLAFLLATVKPEFIVCGDKHKWIWKPYLCRILAKAEQDMQVPKMVLVKSVPGLVRSHTFHGDKDNETLFLDSNRSYILHLLERATPDGKPIKKNECLSQVLEHICFSADASSEGIDSFEKWKDAEEPLENLRAIAGELIDKTLENPRETFLFHEFKVLDPQPYYIVRNATIIDLIVSELRFGESVFNIHKLDSVDQHPEKCRVEYMDVAVKIIRRVAKNVLTDELVTRLEGIIGSCKGMDILLTLINKRYRDHFSHQVNVYGFGLLLLHSWIESLNRQLRDYISEKLNFSNVREVDSAWAIASLFHDLAYPLGFLLGIQDRMKSLVTIGNENQILDDLNRAFFDAVPDIHPGHFLPGNPSLKNDLFNHVSKAKNEIGVSIKDVPIEDILNPEKSQYIDHGVLAATILWDKLNNAANLQEEHLRIIKTALGAIWQHNLKEQPLVIYEEPLATMLRICDELHEWGRPTLSGSGYRCPISLMNVRLPKREGEVRLLPQVLEVEYSCNTRTDLAAVGWDETAFLESKIAALKDKVILPPDGDLIKSIDISIKAPYRFKTNDSVL